MKRCKDCKWSVMKRGRSKVCIRPSWNYSANEMSGWCLGYCMNAKGMKIYGCDDYTRKWWKFWRSK